MPKSEELGFGIINLNLAMRDPFKQQKPFIHIDYPSKDLSDLYKLSSFLKNPYSGKALIEASTFSAPEVESNEELYVKFKKSSKTTLNMSIINY